jgi:hypothetical protein
VTDSRLGKIWELVAEQAADHATGLSAGDACAAAVAGVQVTGGWLNAGADGNGGHLMQATDEVGRYLADLQLTLGEGPSLDAYSAGGPALASDLADAEAGRRWPNFASAACQAGAAAVFTFPLAVGAIRAGVLSLYRDRPGPLSARQLGDALLFADTATLLLLNAKANGSPAAKTNGEPAGFSGYRAEIDQATGMLTEQLGVNITDAFARLRAYAYANDLRLADVARDIVARRLRLHPGSGPSPDINA